ncbi:MAG: alanine--tRNA ligase [Bacteroidia bacterium]|jgi:alanyl-tRNA synthetase|nr:alanine--tRNA ligase [Bacteroidia bacterium]
MNSVEIRKTFLEFFRSKQHLIVPSAPIVVKDDPTLMFTNAGMNQFKEYFLGNVHPKAPRIADTQKCLRVSGKHNDLEEVGYDTYHHTMFEMLGNWSFGDYFKKEAIEWAWELLTEVYGIDKDRLYVTVFGGDPAELLDRDDESFAYWNKIVPAERIIYGSKKDNFWEMGDTGPCGPCSEIHVDIRDQHERDSLPGRELVNTGHPLVIEIWNLVFIEFNRTASGKLEKLPASHVDTGMGFERLSMVLQGKKSNYDTDIFQDIIAEIARLSGKHYGENELADVAMRVIADHLRAVAFTIADGQLPSNTGAGYVIRRILRRAVRYGYTYLGFEEPFVFKLLPVLSAKMSSTFEELEKQKELVSKVIHEEEAAFLRTLSHGIRRFEHYVGSHENEKEISGAFAFELFDTYGFPVDLTNLLAREKGLTVNMEEFANKLNEQKERSRKAAEVAAGDWVVLSESEQPTVFTGYRQLEDTVRILRYREVTAKKKKHYEIVLDRTPFYAESGGQVGDTGLLSNHDERIAISNTVKENNLIVHIAEQLPQWPERQFTATVDAAKRLATANNHSATHLMHAALRKVLGTHVEQKGSLVDHERLRFDFSHFGKMTHEEIREVERLVNEKIRENVAQEELSEVPLEEAKAMGAMALFGEKYGDHVRVIMFDRHYSVELCGGTHVPATGQIGLFKIVSEGAIAAGVRRVEAFTGKAAEEWVDRQLDQLLAIKEIVRGTGDIVRSVQHLADQHSESQKKVEALLSEKAARMADQLLAKASYIGKFSLVEARINDDSEMLKNIAGQIRAKNDDTAAIIYGSFEGKANLVLAFPDKLVNGFGIDASGIIRQAAKHIQGGGGGQKFLATAGGKNPDGLDAAAAEIALYLKSI